MALGSSTGRRFEKQVTFSRDSTIHRSAFKDRRRDKPPPSYPVPNKREPNLNPIVEIGRFIAHPPQFFIGVLQSTRLSSCLHDRFPSCVDPFVGDDKNGQHDKPQTYEPQLNSICGGCQRRKPELETRFGTHVQACIVEHPGTCRCWMRRRRRCC